MEAAFARIDGQLVELDRLIAAGDAHLARLAPRVSAWSLAEQVDHVFKVLAGSIARIQASGEPLPRGINLSGRCALALGWLPRGVGKSPRAMIPTAAPAAELARAAASTRLDLGQLRQRTDLLADPAPWVKHPYFRGLTRGQAVDFMRIHTAHHLKIVRDIERAAV